MSTRRAAILGAWTAFVAAYLIALPLSSRDRLPDPMATHWSGLTPDGAASITGGLVFATALWVALAVLFVVLESVGGRLPGRAGPAGAAGAPRGEARRARRRWCGALLGGAGALFVALDTVSVLANLDAADWHEARLTVWSVVLPPVAGLVCAVVGWWLDTVTAPPQPAPRPAERPRMDLAPRDRVAWTGRAASRVLEVLAVAFWAVGVASVALTVIGPWRPPSALTAGALILGCVILLGRIRVTADHRGLRVAFGPLGRPVQRVALERITSATVEDLRPMDVGGWGYRGLPGNAAIMLRGGPCLVVRYDDDRRRLVVSVDGAEGAAAVLNGLRQHASP